MIINQLSDIVFLTSNPKKASDFSKFGLSIKNFEEEVPEVLSEDVKTVALYKALNTGLNNIVVEDTSLHVDGAKFLGTEIKHVWEEVRENSSFHNHNASWQIALCLKKDDYYYIASAKIDGKLTYPIHETGYHFDKVFSVLQNDKYVHFEALSEKIKMELAPRFIALRKLVHALQTDDFSQIEKIKASEVKQWTGQYQIENPEKPILKVKM